MKCTIYDKINDIFSSEYKTKDGLEKTSYQLEIRNPQPRSSYDRYYRLNIDADCWTMLDLDNKANDYIGKKCKIDASMSQFQNNFNLWVESIALA